MVSNQGMDFQVLSPRPVVPPCGRVRSTFKHNLVRALYHPFTTYILLIYPSSRVSTELSKAVSRYQRNSGQGTNWDN